MNKEELKKETLKRLGKVLGFEPINIPIYRNQDMVNADIVVELAEHYATSQTEALKKEIEELKKKTEWISVEDKLPNEFMSVLVVGMDIRSCALYRDKKFYTDFPLPTNEEITHWMPLPTPPKQ